MGSCLLIGQSHVAGPHGRRKTGPALFVCGAGFLVGADVKAKIRVCRNVRAVPVCRGPPLAELITPGSCCQEGIANAVRGNPSSAVAPTGFRTPGPPGAPGC